MPNFTATAKASNAQSIKLIGQDVVELLTELIKNTTYRLPPSERKARGFEGFIKLAASIDNTDLDGNVDPKKDQAKAKVIAELAEEAPFYIFEKPRFVDAVKNIMNVAGTLRLDTSKAKVAPKLGELAGLLDNKNDGRVMFQQVFTQFVEPIHEKFTKAQAAAQWAVECRHFADGENDTFAIQEFDRAIPLINLPNDLGPFASYDVHIGKKFPIALEFAKGVAAIRRPVEEEEEEEEEEEQAQPKNFEGKLAAHAFKKIAEIAFSIRGRAGVDEATRRIPEAMAASVIVPLCGSLFQLNNDDDKLEVIKIFGGGLRDPFLGHGRSHGFVALAQGIANTPFDDQDVQKRAFSESVALALHHAYDEAHKQDIRTALRPGANLFGFNLP